MWESVILHHHNFFQHCNRFTISHLYMIFQQDLYGLHFNCVNRTRCHLSRIELFLCSLMCVQYEDYNKQNRIIFTFERRMIYFSWTLISCIPGTFVHNSHSNNTWILFSYRCDLPIPIYSFHTTPRLLES
jgi:hypothetical protein